VNESVQFYPSHLTKGVIAGAISLVFGLYALREFSLIGTDVYPPAQSVLKP